MVPKRIALAQVCVIRHWWHYCCYHFTLSSTHTLSLPPCTLFFIKPQYHISLSKVDFFIYRALETSSRDYKTVTNKISIVLYQITRIKTIQWVNFNLSSLSLLNRCFTFWARAYQMLHSSWSRSFMEYLYWNTIPSNCYSLVLEL